jgi:hypothetical protein
MTGTRESRRAVLTVALVCVAVALAQVVGAQETRVTGQVVSWGQKPIRKSMAAMVRLEQALRRSSPKRPGGVVMPEPIGVLPDPESREGDEGATRSGAFGSSRAAQSVQAPQAVNTGFQSIGLQDQFNSFSVGSIPPDTMGAVGPDHFVVNINTSFAIYTKAGALASHVRINNFFAFNDGVAFPANGAFDPRILFDKRSGRWFATVMERGVTSGRDNDIALAVSETGDPTGTWDFYRIPLGQADSGSDTFFTDYSTLGTDDNGVYFGTRIFKTTSGVGNGSNATIAATPKASLLAASPSIGTVTQFTAITDMFSTPQPAHNQSAVNGTDPAWFVASSSSFFSDIRYRTLVWSGGAPILDSSSTTLTSDAFSSPINAPASGSTTNVNVGDMRAQMAVIRNDRLWTCRNVGVNSSGTNTSADRTGVEWFEWDVSSASASILQQGRVFDSASSDPLFFYYPSIMVNGQGHAAMGFSGSNSAQFVAAYTCGRLSSDANDTMQSVALVKAGEDSYTRLDTSSRNRWGDYSYTSLDPDDDMTIWTVQEYAEDTATANVWGTWITSLNAPAPTLNHPGGAIRAGRQNASISLTGTGIFDPGAGYDSRLTASISGNGISDLAITFNSSSSATLTFDVSNGATTGLRDILLTNPDGQSVFRSEAFQITPALAAPDNLVATASAIAKKVVLTWNDNSSENTGYGVQRSINGSAFQGIANLGDVITFEDFGVAASTTYNYRVVAYVSPDISLFSNTDDAVTPAAPTAPSGLTADADPLLRRVDLAWSDDSSDETGFIVYRQIGAGPLKYLGTLAAGTESFTDTKASASTTYTYHVRAANVWGFNASNTDDATTGDPPAAPTGLTATLFTGPRRVVLDWGDASTNELGFYIYRQTDGGSFVFKGPVGAGSTTFTDTNVPAGHTYTYIVTARNGWGTANSASATP